jgi:hypothetical protein
MGDEPASFERKQKISGGRHMPFCKSFPFGQTIERDIQFDGGKIPAVIGKPMVL